VVICGNCGAENPPGKKFCTECGTTLALACPTCGAPIAGTEKFCGECGSPLGAAAPPPAVARIGPIFPLAELGRWQEALARAAEADQLQASRWARSEVISAVPVLCEQGRPDDAESLLREHEWLRDADQAEMPTHGGAVEARVLRARGRPAKALAAAERGLSHVHEVGPTNRRVKVCLVEALEHGLAFHHASTQLEHADWLVGRGRARDAQELLTEARQTFERLEATPWLERLEAAEAAAPAATVSV
jgi:Double zinc ribbon